MNTLRNETETDRKQHSYQSKRWCKEAAGRKCVCVCVCFPGAAPWRSHGEQVLPLVCLFNTQRRVFSTLTFQAKQKNPTMRRCFWRSRNSPQTSSCCQPELRLRVRAMGRSSSGVCIPLIPKAGQRQGQTKGRHLWLTVGLPTKSHSARHLPARKRFSWCFFFHSNLSVLPWGQE